MPELEPPIPYRRETFDLDPETLLNAMRFRRSIRRFTGEKLTRRQLELLLDAGRCAPTSSNSQSVGFVVLDEEFEAMRPKIWWLQGWQINVKFSFPTPLEWLTPLRLW